MGTCGTRPRRAPPAATCTLGRVPRVLLLRLLLALAALRPVDLDRLCERRERESERGSGERIKSCKSSLKSKDQKCEERNKNDARARAERVKIELELMRRIFMRRAPPPLSPPSSAGCNPRRPHRRPGAAPGTGCPTRGVQKLALNLLARVLVEDLDLRGALPCAAFDGLGHLWW